MVIGVAQQFASFLGGGIRRNRIVDVVGLGKRNFLVVSVNAGTAREDKTLDPTPATALQQLCRALSPGFSQFMFDLTGLRRTAGGLDGDYKPKFAIEILNRLINYRFDSRLLGQGFILDRRNNRVEGLVGPRYEFYSNLEMLERCDEFAVKSDRPAKFFSASVIGRL